MEQIRISALTKKSTTEKRVEEATELVLEPGCGICGAESVKSTDRQVSILPKGVREDGRNDGLCWSRFIPNIELEGLDTDQLFVGMTLRIGGAVVEICVVGKTCIDSCPLFQKEGPCTLSQAASFGRVVSGGTIRIGQGVTYG